MGVAQSSFLSREGKFRKESILTITMAVLSLCLGKFSTVIHRYASDSCPAAFPINTLKVASWKLVLNIYVMPIVSENPSSWDSMPCAMLLNVLVEFCAVKPTGVWWSLQTRWVSVIFHRANVQNLRSVSQEPTKEPSFLVGSINISQKLPQIYPPTWQSLFPNCLCAPYLKIPTKTKLEYHCGPWKTSRRHRLNRRSLLWTWKDNKTTTTMATTATAGSVTMR